MTKSRPEIKYGMSDDEPITLGIVDNGSLDKPPAGRELHVTITFRDNHILTGNSTRGGVLNVEQVTDLRDRLTRWLDTRGDLTFDSQAPPKSVPEFGEILVSTYPR